MGIDEVTEQYKGCEIKLTDLHVVSGTGSRTRWVCNVRVRRNGQPPAGASMVEKEIYFFAAGCPNGADALALALGQALSQCDFCLDNCGRS